MTSYTLDTSRVDLSDDQFFQLCIDNRDFRFERSAKGEVIFMPPTGGATGEKNSEINFQLRLWNNRHKRGKVFDSSTGFLLPNRAVRSPDAAWISLVKWESLTVAEQQKFLPFAPDFVIELLSPSDRLENTQQKMLEYLENGTQLAWLINQKMKQVEIYRPKQPMEQLESPQTLSGEAILVDFTLDLQPIWS